MIPLISIVTSATVTAGTLLMCSSKERQATHKPQKSSSKSASKSHRSHSKSKDSSTKSARSSKSSRRSKRSKKHRSSKKRDSKRAVSSKKSEKDDKGSEKPDKCEAEQCEKIKRDSVLHDASSKSDATSMTSAPKSRRRRSSRSSKRHSKSKSKSKSTSKSLSGEEKERMLRAVPNESVYLFPDCQVKSSSFRASPNKLPFAPSGGIQTVKFSNTTKARRAFKVKVSDTDLYRVNPVFGFVEPGADISIDVLRHNGGSKTDHMVVLTAEGDGENPMAIFESHPPRELTVVPLIAK